MNASGRKTRSPAFLFWGRFPFSDLSKGEEDDNSGNRSPSIKLCIWKVRAPVISRARPLSLGRSPLFWGALVPRSRGAASAVPQNARDRPQHLRAALRMVGICDRCFFRWQVHSIPEITLASVWEGGETTKESV